MLDALPDGAPRLLIEPTAGGGKSLAATVEDLGPYLAALENHPMVGVCFDTCHAWAAGHDLSVPGGMTATLDALVAAVGPGRLGLVHANDSLDACGSKRDRHTTIGAGSIGAAPFAELLAHPSMAGVPVVVETPSELDGSPSAGHARDIALLCSLRRRAAPRGLTPPAVCGCAVRAENAHQRPAPGPPHAKAGGVDRTDVPPARLGRARHPGEAEAQGLPAHRRHEGVAPDVCLPLGARPVPGRTVHLHRQHRLLARRIQHERLAPTVTRRCCTNVGMPGARRTCRQPQISSSL